MGKEGESIRRRRECLKCEGRFTTYERVEEVLPLVIKKDGRREPFDRLKILNGLKKACEKRPVGVEALERTVTDIEKSLQEKGLKEIQSAMIGEEVMERLHKLDEVAYVRFASVYRSFRDINEFMNELKDILSAKKKKSVAENPSEKKKRAADANGEPEELTLPLDS
jgi:transcriptional repressor NrdR